MRLHCPVCDLTHVRREVFSIKTMRSYQGSYLRASHRKILAAKPTADEIYRNCCKASFHRSTQCAPSITPMRISTALSILAAEPRLAHYGLSCKGKLHIYTYTSLLLPLKSCVRCRILKTKCSRSVWFTRACRLRGKRLPKRAGASASKSLSRKKFLCVAGVIKAAVTKVLEKQKWVRLLPPELSPSYHANALCYPISIHIICPLP